MFLLVLLTGSPQGVAESPRLLDLDSIRGAFERGRFEQAIVELELALESSRQGAPGQRAPAMLLLAEGYDALGRLNEAVNVLEQAVSIAESLGDPALSIVTNQRLGVAQLRIGRWSLARQNLDKALTAATESGRDELRARVLNDLGVFHGDSGDIDSALSSFSECERLARQLELQELRLVAGCNMAEALIQAGRSDDLEARLNDNLSLARNSGASRLKAIALISIGSHYWMAQWRFGLPAQWRSQAFGAYWDALQLTRSLGDRRLTSYTLGSIGRLYEDEHRYPEALGYTRQAMFEAQTADAADISYLWDWQLGRIFRAQGNPDAAIASYRQALLTFQRLRTELAQSRFPFTRYVGPVFRELADLLLRRASMTADPQVAQRDLDAVRSTLEELKRAEVSEYFRDDCIVQNPGSAGVESVSPKAAILYPVLLADRTELLVSFPDRLEHRSIAVGLAELTATVREFRIALEVVESGSSFEPYARRLYDWLIRPLEQDFRRQEIDTLVIVPDGPLRTIPLAALHDGQRYLVEEFAVVTIPGLNLTSSRPTPREALRALAGGLTEGVQGFSPLPNVAAELASIEATYATTVLQDDSFRTARIARDIAAGDYTVLHFATHGHFDRDPSNSYLLTFDGKITMDGLQDSLRQRRYREEPVEVLVLSACETAAGDDRAALGLAGVGLKAGARSVLASLWSISDESTAQLVSEFHRQLRAGGTTKAEALRTAQRSLLSQTRFRHPYYWASFILIGNWL